MSNVPVRLVGGDQYSGRLEVFYNNIWGTVCQQGFNILAANTVCRQLGFNSGAITYYGGAHYGPGSGKVWLTNVSCSPSDNNIATCGHSYWGKTDVCTHEYDVSIDCNPGKLILSTLGIFANPQYNFAISTFA